MSKVEELLLRLCPNGVTFKRVDDVCIRHSGLPLTAGEMRVLNIPGGDVRIFAGGQTFADVNSDSIDGKFIDGPGLIVKSRGIIDFEFWLGRYSHKNEFWSYRPKGTEIDLKFLYYFFKTKVMDVQLIAKANSVKMPQIKVGDIDSMLVPVPPIEVQIEIVRILDTFMNLEAELEAELKARKSQYTFFSDRLFTFTNLEASAEGVYPLGELVEVMNGYAFKSSAYSEEGVRVVRITNVQKGRIVDADPKYYPFSLISELERYLLREGDLLVSLTGNVGRVGQISSALLPAGLNQRVACLRVRDTQKLDLRFLFHLLNDSRFEIACLAAANGSAQANLSTEWLKDYLVQIPPLEIQAEAVGILDTFIKLEAELEAELEARKSQYSHYRNTLFTFRELEVV